MNISLTAGGAEVHVTVYQNDSLTGAVVSSGGISQAVNDVVTLHPVGGVAVVPATVQIAAASLGVATAVSIVNAGQFSSNPTSFTQASTTGIGTGLTLNALSFAAISQAPAEIVWTTDAVLQPVAITPDATGFNFAAPVGMLPTLAAAGAYATNANGGGQGTVFVTVVDATLMFTSP
jgi:hypothetical protein